jgi:hypothetical protein
VNSFPATATLTINGSSFAGGTYSLAVTGTSGSISHSVSVPFDVGDYSVSGTQTLALAPGGQGTANLTVTPLYFYTGQINATCDASALPGAMCTLSPSTPLTLASGGTANLTATINVPNDAANGSYNINISTHDTKGAPSHTFKLSVTIGEDFILTSSTPSQTVDAGQSTGPYNLTIQPVGASFNAAVTLSCSSGLPALTQCIFNPPSAVTPGNSAANVVMSISTTATTTAHASEKARAIFYAMWLLLPGMAIVWGSVRRGPKRHKRGVLSAIATCLLLVLPSCGGISTGSVGGGHQGTPPGSYTITVTGASSGAPPDAGQHTQVILVVH